MKRNTFAYRHIGPTEKETEAMLSVVKADSLDSLINETVPANIRSQEALDISAPMTESEFAEHIAELAAANKVFKTYIGMGYHPTVLPSVIQRNIFENPGWYTAYTPYQAEIAQGHCNGTECYLDFARLRRTQFDLLNNKGFVKSVTNGGADF